MAAYAALISLQHLIHDIQNHHSPPISLDEQQVESLTEKLTFLLKFLEGYTSPIADVDDEADPLEIRIADAAYAAEDVIESNIVEVIRLGRCEEVNCINFYEDLHLAIEEMDLIKKMAMKIDAEMAAVHHHQVYYGSSNAKVSTFTVFSEGVVLEILHQLTGDKRGRRQVIPIVGMAGIGKTTLATYIFQNSLINEHFDICAWATISQQYKTREILCQLLSPKKDYDGRSDDELKCELHKYLFGRRYLIVMDDMWSIDAWEDMQHIFPDNYNGSRVLVTTRLSQLSSQLNNSYSFEMKFLDEVNSWDLFCKTVFGKESCPFELEETGKKIVENCRGLPLSIVVVGGLLKKMERSRGCWEPISNNMSSVVNLENDKLCLRLLRMSYNHLPLYIKPCFLYMGVFEEDYRVRVSRLVTLWVSEGFIKPMDGERLETIGKGYLKELVDRNLVIIDELGCTGNIKWCKIHDLVRDLCLRESKEYGFYHVIGEDSSRGLHGLRRVVIGDNISDEKVVATLQSTSHTRTVICGNKKVPPLKNFSLLRTLHTNMFGHLFLERRLNDHVFQCVNLRHLVTKVGRMASFLPWIDLTWNLQTLVVEFFGGHFQVGIWKMPQLRHIESILTPLYLPYPHLHDGENEVLVLENLEILKGIHNLKFGREVVKRIPNVRKLKLAYGDDDNGDDFYCLSNLESLCKLESVEFTNYRRSSEFLHNLTFPCSLKSLDFYMLQGDFEWEEMLEKIGSLPHLQKLKLKGGWFESGKWEIVEGQFPSLRYLKLDHCHNLKQWTVAQESSSVFPLLEHLLLHGCFELEDIPCEIGDISTLQRVELSYCSETVVMCARRIVEEQVKLQGEEPFRVTII